eukprot:GEMP01023500.1.p1 GENE.GEMP01023500.1~~GEMP01023500.1.p1  ORF type:complete len:389 (+),score=57.64 GEMP01023500.1:142-1308(+)
MGLASSSRPFHAAAVPWRIRENDRRLESGQWQLRLYNNGEAFVGNTKNTKNDELREGYGYFADSAGNIYNGTWVNDQLIDKAAASLPRSEKSNVQIPFQVQDGISFLQKALHRKVPGMWIKRADLCLRSQLSKQVTLSPHPTYNGQVLGKHCVIKVFPRLKSQEDARRWVTTIEALQFCRHPNLALMLGTSCSPTGNPMVLTEYVSQGSIAQWLYEKKEAVTVQMALHIAKGVAVALYFLHSKTVRHHSLSSDCVLLDGSLQVKVTNYGLGNFCTRETVYTPPEVLRGQYVDELGDSYSFGILLWELFTQHRPFQDIPHHLLRFCIGYARLQPPSIHAPTVLRILLENCIAWKPEMRPTAGEIVERLNTLPTITMTTAHDGLTTFLTG